MTSCSVPSPSPSRISIIVVLLAVVLPRMMVVGALPTTDEGFQVYYAQIMYAGLTGGTGLPDFGPLMLYALLVNWVFALDVNPIIALRLVDMLIAVAAGYALYRVIESESRNRLGAILITALFLFTMNQPLFTEHGFKNSIHAAYLPLFTALWLGLTASANTTISARRWLGIGALLSVAVLLRETFLPLMALGAVAVLLGHGVRPFGQLVTGAAGAGALITGIILVARGGIVATFESYRDAGFMYAALDYNQAEFFFKYGTRALNEGAIVLAMAGIGFAITLARSLGHNRVTSLPRLGFWAAAALIPLIEPTLKISFPYHFGVCLPGLAGLTALGWRNTCEGSSTLKLRLAVGIMSLSLLTMVSSRLALLASEWPQTQEALASFQSGKWPKSFTDKTNYLLIAQAIRQATPPEGTVAVSGFMFTLYPLTGHLPPTPELANLTTTLIKFEFSVPRLREALLRCPPDVLMITTRTDWSPGGPELLAAVRETGIYEQIAEIPKTGNRAYGSFGGIIFRTTKKLPCKPLIEPDSVGDYPHQLTR